MMKTLQIGAVRIDKIDEIPSMDVDPKWLLPNITDADMARHAHWIAPCCMDAHAGRLKMSFHAFLIRTPTRTILVDSCNGNDKERPSMPAWHRLNTPFLHNLAALGVRPEDIDMVLCTHLHADHVGWNTRLENGRWVPTFPNARYLMGKQEFEHFHKAHVADPSAPINRGSFVDSVLPIVEAGRADFVHAQDRVLEEIGTCVRLEGAPGHTPGNLCVHVQKEGAHAIMSGDVIHHPIQCAEPHISNGADFDRQAAMQSRLDLLHTCADSGKILLTGHFAGTTAGHVVSHGDAFRFKFLTP